MQLEYTIPAEVRHKRTPRRGGLLTERCNSCGVVVLLESAQGMFTFDVRALLSSSTKTTPSGVSADRVHGLGRLNVQNASRREDIRRRGSADHLSRQHEEGWHKDQNRQGTADP